MSVQAVLALDSASDCGETVHISPITAWELGILIARNRLKTTMSAKGLLNKFISTGNATWTSLSTDILIDSSFLPGDPPNDPADRIIIATARELGMTIITRDQLILDYADTGHVRAIAC